MKRSLQVVYLAMFPFLAFASDTEKMDQKNSRNSSLKEGMVPAYNAPARIAPQRGWDAFGSVSFIYWYATQDGMDLALPSAATANGSPPPSYVTLNPPANGSNFLFSDFSFHPGFKLDVGMNFNRDGWVGDIEYTRLHQTTTTDTESAPTDPRSGNTNVWIVSNWYADLQPISSNIGASWEMNLDLIQATLSRPFYQGRELVILPSGGIAALILNQKMDLSAALLGASIQPATSTNFSHSWGVGPCVGLESQWLVGKGVRLDGNVGASLLFTQYTKVNHQDTATFPAATVPQSATSFQYVDYNTLRPLANFSLGIGWNYNFPNQGPTRWNLDLMASYEWNILWGQNMMRALLDNFLQGTGVPQDLYLQGLTLTSRFSF